MLGGAGRGWVVLGGVGRGWVVLGGTGWGWVVLGGAGRGWVSAHEEGRSRSGGADSRRGPGGVLSGDFEGVLFCQCSTLLEVSWFSWLTVGFRRRW